MQTLILNDTISVINENQDFGNIISANTNKLRRLIRKLYNHLYFHYEEFSEGGLNNMMDEGIILEAELTE